MANLVEKIKKLSPDKQKEFIHSLSPEEAVTFFYDFQGIWARKKQKFPKNEEWRIWLILAGRGFGKTRTGVESVRYVVENNQAERIGLIAPTAADARDVIVTGESGILNSFPPHIKPKYEPSKRKLTFPNGAVAFTFSADDPERLRGYQYDFLYMDELAAWKYQQESFDMAMFGLRLGKNPRAVITTTPKPTKIIKDLIKDDGVKLTTGSTFENKDNLAKPFLNQILNRYENTRLGAQEIYGQILNEVEGALWNRSLLERDRIKYNELPALNRIVIGVDPAVSNNENSAETGIVVVGIADDQNGYVLEDASIQASPDEWARRVVEVYHKYEADLIVAEANNGGDLVKTVLKTVDQTINVRMVHAQKNKVARAEPVSALYEQQKVFHVGFFSQLEEQQCEFVAGAKSPDRLDALCWAITYLMLKGANTSPRMKGLEDLSKTSTWNL